MSENASSVQACADLTLDIMATLSNGMTAADSLGDRQVVVFVNSTDGTAQSETYHISIHEVAL